MISGLRHSKHLLKYFIITTKKGYIQLETLPNDIEPIVEIINYSFYYFIAILVALFITVYFTIKSTLNFLKKRDNLKFQAINELKTLDWSDSKAAAYKITELGRVVSGSDRSQRVLDSLIQELEQYKYRKSVDEVSDTVKGQLNIFLEVIENE